FIVKYPSDKNVDAALFWLAYAHNKQGNYQAASDTLSRLLKSYPRSSWADDARALRVEVLAKLRPGAPVDVPEDSNDDLKIIALRALCENDKATCSTRISEVLRSIHALAGHESPRAVTILGEVATSGKNMRARTHAIEIMSRRRGDNVVDELLRLYDAVPELQVKKYVLAGFAMRKDPRALNKLADV